MKFSYLLIATFVISACVSSLVFFTLNVVTKTPSCSVVKPVHTIKHAKKIDKDRHLKTKLYKWCLARAKHTVPKSDIIKIINEVFKYDTPMLLLAIIKVESTFDNSAESHVGAAGLM